jgi:hypothetical protein
MGPRAKWAKRFLPNSANRIVFLILVCTLIVVWMVQGVGDVVHGDRGEGYFTVTYAVLCGAALCRFIYEWWMRTPVEGVAQPK